MAKRKKVTTAGLLVKAVIYTPPQPRDSDYTRAVKSRMTTAARRAMNVRTAQSKLEMLLAANFGGADLLLHPYIPGRLSPAEAAGGKEADTGLYQGVPPPAPPEGA